MVDVTVKGENWVWRALNIGINNLRYLKQVGNDGKLIVEQDGIRKMVTVRNVELCELREPKVVDLTETQTLPRFKK